MKVEPGITGEDADGDSGFIFQEVAPRGPRVREFFAKTASHCDSTNYLDK